jgi:hypothetical protein
MLFYVSLSCSMMRKYTKRTQYAHIITHACVCAHTPTYTHTHKYIQSIMHIKAFTFLSVRRHMQIHTLTHASCAGVSGECNTPWKELGWHSSPFSNPGKSKSVAPGSAAADLKFNGGHPVGIELVKGWEMGLAAGPDGGIFPTP